MEKSPKKDMILLNLKKLNEVMEEKSLQEKKFFTILDHTGQCEVFFKYTGYITSALEEDYNDSQKRCKQWLKTMKYPRTLSFNFEDLPIEKFFDDKWFPPSVLDPKNYQSCHFFEPFRKSFPEFDEEIWPNKDFKMIFLFKKNNIPDVFWEKTYVLDVYNEEEYTAKLAEKEKEAQEETKEELAQKISTLPSDVNKAGQANNAKSNTATKATVATKINGPTKTASKTTKTSVTSQTSAKTTTTQPKSGNSGNGAITATALKQVASIGSLPAKTTNTQSGQALPAKTTPVKTTKK